MDRYVRGVQGPAETGQATDGMLAARLERDVAEVADRAVLRGVRCHPLTVVLYALAALLGGGDVVAAITGNIVGVLWGILSAFLTAWLGWFMLIKRQPYCCCLCILWFENWTYTHLLFGLFIVFNGVQFVLLGVRALLSSMDTMDSNFVGFIFNVAATAMSVIIAITQIYVGRAAVGVGQKIAGITLPAVTAGKGEQA